MKIFQKFQFSLENILENGIYLLVFLLPIQTRVFLKQSYLGGAFWEYGSISIYSIDILLLGLFIISTIVMSRRKKEFNIKKIWFLLAIFEFFVFISIFFAESKSMAIYGYLKILLGFILFFVITENKFNEKKMILSFLSGVFLQAIIGIAQFFINFSFPNKYLGMAEHNPDVLGTFVIELGDKTRILRAYGGLDHPNIFGAFIFLGIFVYVRYLLNLKNRNKLSIKKQLIYFSILSVFMFSFLISFSRAAYLIFILYFLFLIFWSVYDKNRRRLLSKIILTFFLVILISFFFHHNLFLERFDSSSRLENISNQERMGQVEDAKGIITDNLFFGVGINNYTKELSLEDTPAKEAWNYQPVHDVYLLVLAEIGIFGFLSFFVIFLYFLNITFKKGLFFDFYIVFSLILLFLVDHWLWSLHFGILFLFFILALVQKRIRA